MGKGSILETMPAIIFSERGNKETYGFLMIFPFKRTYGSPKTSPSPVYFIKGGILREPSVPLT